MSDREPTPEDREWAEDQAMGLARKWASAALPNEIKLGILAGIARGRSGAPTPAPALCPECRGTGKRMQSGPEGDEVAGACRRCGGMGTVPATPAETAPVSEPTWPCSDCGRRLTRAEGGNVFTYCDACWDKPGRRAPVAPPAPTTAPEVAAAKARWRERGGKVPTDAVEVPAPPYDAETANPLPGCGCDLCRGKPGAVYTEEHLRLARMAAEALRGRLGWTEVPTAPVSEPTPTVDMRIDDLLIELAMVPANQHDGKRRMVVAKHMRLAVIDWREALRAEWDRDRAAPPAPTPAPPTEPTATPRQGGMADIFEGTDVDRRDSEWSMAFQNAGFKHPPNGPLGVKVTIEDFVAGAIADDREKREPTATAEADVERVARALCERGRTNGCLEDWDNEDDGMRESLREDARVAIAAMRGTANYQRGYNDGARDMEASRMTPEELRDRREPKP